jgi:Tfp pilus assembly protein PilF
MDFLLLHAVLFFGRTDFIVRLPAAIYGIGATLVLFLVGRSLMGTREGLLGAYLLALSAFHLEYSQEAKFYSLFILMELLSLWTFSRAVNHSSWRRWLAFAIVTSLGLYTHYFISLVILSELLFLVAASAYHRLAAKRSDLRFPPISRTTFASFVLAICGALLFFLPWVSYAVLAERGLRIRPPAFTLSLVKQFFQSFSGGSQVSLLVFGSAFLLGTIGLFKRRNGNVVLLLLVVILPMPIALFLIHVIGGFYFVPRHVILILPIYLLIGASGVTFLITELSAIISRLHKGWASGARNVTALVFVLFLGGTSLLSIRDYYLKPKTDWRGASQYLTAHVQRGDLIIAVSVSDGDYVKVCLPYYYTPSMANDVPLINLRLPGSDLAAQVRGESIRPWWGFDFWGELSGESEKVHRLLAQEFDLVRFAGVTIVQTRSPVNVSSEEVLRQTTSILQAFTKTTLDRLPVFHEQLGNVYAARGLVDQSIAEYERALELEPGYFSAHMNLGSLYRTLGQFEEAKAEFERALTISPDNTWVHYRLGELYQEQGDLQRALDGFLLAVQAFPYNEWAHLSIGGIYQSQGNLQAALAEFQRTAEINPGNEWAHFRLGEIYRAQGRIEEAVKEYEKTLEINPENDAAKEALRALGR